MSNWISVKDKLPQEGETILVWAGKPEITWFTWKPFATESGGFDDYGFARWDNFETVTHWMPIKGPHG